MRRREFLIRSASGLGSAWLSSKSILNAIASTDALSKILRLRHRHPWQHRHQNQPPRHGHRHGRLRDIIRIRPRSASKASPTFCSTDTITACASSMPPILTAAILMLPKLSSTCSATKSPC